jgi:hypothetical protein
MHQIIQSYNGLGSYDAVVQDYGVALECVDSELELLWLVEGNHASHYYWVAGVSVMVIAIQSYVVIAVLAEESAEANSVLAVAC